MENIKEGSSGSVNMNYSNLEDKPIGNVHTHPYSIEEGEHTGVPFSSYDIANVWTHNSENKVGGIPFENGAFSMVESGTKRFSIMIVDSDKARSFFKKMNRNKVIETFNKAYENAKGTLAEKQLAGNLKVLGSSKNSGLLLMETTNKEKTKFKTLKLIKNMKYVLLVFIFICNFSCNPKTKYNGIQLKDYIDKPFSNFIGHHKFSNYKSFNWIDEPPLKLQGVLLEYDEDLFVEIRVGNFKHIKQLNKKMDWSFEDFKKELINSIVVYKEGENGEKIISSIFSKGQ